MDMGQFFCGIVKGMPEKPNDVIMNEFDFLDKKMVGQEIIIQNDFPVRLPVIDMNIQRFDLIFIEMPAGFQYGIIPVLVHLCILVAVSYTHLTLPTIYSV